MIETLPLHHVARVCSLLARGHLVAYPTGTAYALGGNALDRSALAKLTAWKRRPPEKAYSVLLPTAAPERFVIFTPEERAVYDRLGQNPLTLLVRAAPALLHLARDGRVGIRNADHPFTRELAALLPFPVTATSANLSGSEAAYDVTELADLAPAAECLFVVDGGRLPRGLPSTVARREGERWRLLREGTVTRDDLAEAVSGARPPSPENERTHTAP